jgi:hypothetical protein
MNSNPARFGAALAYGLKRAADESDDEQDNDKEPAAPKANSGDAAGNLRRQRARNRAEDLVPMKGFGRGYADYLLPSTFGGTRAGRATMIAKALGQKPDFSVSHPNTDQMLGSFGGMLGGGAIGAGLGGLAGALTGNLDNAAIGALTGLGVGGTGGSLAGIVGSGMQRREQMQKIQNSLAKELESHGTSRMKLDPPQYGALSSLLQPLSGAHRAGQADAYEALRDNTRYAKTPGRTTGYLAAHIPYAGAAVQVGQGIGQNFSARKRMKQAPKQPIEDNYGLEEFGPAKAASAFEFGVKLADAWHDNFNEKVLNSYSDMGQKAEQESQNFATAAPYAGQAVGQMAGGNIGRVLGGGAGALLGQQARHMAADVGVQLGSRSPHQPIPLGVSNGQLTRQPTPDSLASGRQLENTRLRIGKPNAPGANQLGPLVPGKTPPNAFAPPPRGPAR